MSINVGQRKKQKLET